MFFRKAKRIKELEKENEHLRRLNSLLQSTNGFPVQQVSLKIERINATGEYPPWYNHKIMEDEVKHRLVSELSPFMRIDEDFDEASDKWLLRASIRVVKERQY